MRWCAVLLVVGCAETASLGVGPTLDGDGHLGVNGDAAEGPLPWNQGGLSSHVWVFGIGASLGATTSRPYVQWALRPYVEYLDVGAMGSPWGWHARLAVGFTCCTGVFGAELSVGPTRLSSIMMRDTNDGLTTVFDANGVDASVQWSYPLEIIKGIKRSPWLFGLRYEHLSTTEWN